MWLSPTQVPVLQASPVVHRSPSLHAVPSGLAGLEQIPGAGSHTPASWHWSDAVQITGAPLLHVPPPQVSPTVHALPSSQGAVLLRKTQPDAGLQVSSVQPLPSLHTRGAPGLQLAPPQVSPTVHASPSSHADVLAALTQPIAGSQPSFVQPLASSHASGAPPLQVPPPQLSFVVHASPSSHATVLSACTQPTAGSQESSVQGLSSSQFTGSEPLKHGFAVSQASPMPSRSTSDWS